MVTFLILSVFVTLLTGCIIISKAARLMLTKVEESRVNVVKDHRERLELTAEFETVT